VLATLTVRVTPVSASLAIQHLTSYVSAVSIALKYNERDCFRK